MNRKVCEVMKYEDIQEMVKTLDNKPKILIIKKEFYEQFKNETNDLIKDIWNLELAVTNILDEKTNAILMDADKFFGIN